MNAIRQLRPAAPVMTGDRFSTRSSIASATDVRRTRAAIPHRLSRRHQGSRVHRESQTGRTRL